MKFSLSLLAMFIAVSFSYAQNTFPDNGNVGIGTTTPVEALVVTGNIKSNQRFLLNNLESTTSFNNAYYVYRNSNYYGLDLGFNSVSGRYGTRLFTPTDGDIVFSSLPSYTTPVSQTQFTQLLTIKGSNGNVGIGTAIPGASLQIGNYAASSNNAVVIPGAYNFEQIRLGQISNGNSALEFVNHNGVASSYGIRLLVDIDHSAPGLQKFFLALLVALILLNALLRRRILSRSIVRCELDNHTPIFCLSKY